VGHQSNHEIQVASARLCFPLDSISPEAGRGGSAHSSMYPYAGPESDFLDQRSSFESG
jgi:hypothetical protein